jgi:hypothetical protein
MGAHALRGSLTRSPDQPSVLNPHVRAGVAGAALTATEPLSLAMPGFDLSRALKTEWLPVKFVRVARIAVMVEVIVIRHRLRLWSRRNITCAYQP